MKSSVFWDIIHVLDKLCLYLVHAGFLLALLFNPENGGSMFLQNIS
jgi:hypothetical protein